MKGDFTRSTFRNEKHYSGVRQQQGRVQLDADWNEQADIETYLREVSLADLIGECGAPRDPETSGFKVGLADSDKNLSLSKGHLYVDGILCELGADATFTTQFDGQDPVLGEAMKKLVPPYPPLPTADGTYFVYLDAWQRHVTALEDPSIRETALGGPDTATRTQTFWHVKLHPVTAGSHCLSEPQSWKDLIAQPSGKLKAQTTKPQPSDTPCIVPASAGYTRLENQLYRVEIHTGGPQGSATFKWSRENGSVAAEWLQPDSADKKRLKVRYRRDTVLGFAKGDWVELIDDTREPKGQPGVLMELDDVQDDVLILKLDGPPWTDFPVRPKVRRWDHRNPDGADNAIKIPASTSQWITLEGDIQVAFEPGPAGTYRTGDYWLIPARAFIGEFSGDIEWPKDGGGNPVPQVPHGVRHHYCKLAVVDFTAATKIFSNVRDCRPLFPAVTELIRFFMVGGDGQEAMPGKKLACPLTVGVTNGQWPVIGARVRFTATPADGVLVPPSGTIVGTNANGLASCSWTLPAVPPAGDPPCLTVTATLLDVAGNTISIPLTFHANLSIASQVAYDPGDCTHLGQAKTVQEALDILCRNVSISYVGGDGQEGSLGEVLAHPLEVRVSNGRSPQPGAQVRFTIAQNAGALTKVLGDVVSGNGSPNLVVKTTPEGLAACTWKLGGDSGLHQRVEAVLLDAAGIPISGQIIHFNASQPALVVTAVNYKNDSAVRADLFAGQEIIVTCNRDLADVFSPDTNPPPPPPSPPAARPNVQVLLYVPFPLPLGAGFWDFKGVAGFEPVLLAGWTSTTNKEIHWRATKECQVFLASVLFDRLHDPRDPTAVKHISERLLVRLILKGNYIWSKDAPELFLDGNAFGLPPSTKPVSVRLPSGDGQTGGDFEMWFWLTPPPDRPVDGDFFFDAVFVRHPPRGPRQVTGMLKLPPGQAFGDIVLTLVGADDRDVFNTTPDERGAFQFMNVPTGDLRVRLQVGDKVQIVNVRPAPPLPEDLRLTDVDGVGPATEGKLLAGGIGTPTHLAAAEPATVAEILGISKERAQTLIENAKRLAEP